MRRFRPWHIGRVPGNGGGPGGAGAFCTFDKHRGAALLRGLNEASADFVGGETAFGVTNREAEGGAIDVKNPAGVGKILGQRHDRRFERNSSDPHFHVTTRPNPFASSTRSLPRSSISDSKFVPRRAAP